MVAKTVVQPADESVGLLLMPQLVAFAGDTLKVPDDPTITFGGPDTVQDGGGVGSGSGSGSGSGLGSESNIQQLPGVEQEESLLHMQLGFSVGSQGRPLYLQSQVSGRSLVEHF